MTAQGGLTAGNIAGHTAVGAASLIASAATRSAIEGSSFGANIRAGLPDVIGQVLGRALVGAAQGGGGRSPGGVAGAAEAATEPALQQPGLSLELDTKANLRRATDSAFAMLNDLESANNRTYGGADLAAGAGNAPLGSGTGLPVSGPNQDGDASVIWIRRTHDYEPLPAQVLETGRYYAVTKAVSEATQGNLAAHWEQWRHLSADRLQPLLQALVASEVPGARVLLGPDHINYLANPDNLTAPRFADYTYYEETSAYQRFMTSFSLTTIGSGVYGYFGVANAEMRATNPLSAAVGEYGQYAMGVVSLARAGIRTGVAETVEFAAESNVARFVYDAKAARYRSAESGQFVSARDLPWPGNAGFSSSAMETVPAGRILDRFGNASGRYLGEPGATASARGMAPGADAMPYSQYRVVTPFQARVGPAAPVPDFGAAGGATQYLSGKSVQQLIDAGHLVRVK